MGASNLLPNELAALASEQYCYLTTTGRITGRPRTIEIWFALNGTTLYMLSGNRDRADWVKNAVKNAVKNSDVSIRIATSVFPARARIVTDQSEDTLARRLLYEKYSASDDDLEDWKLTALPVAFEPLL
jgi:hypothetical protein